MKRTATIARALIATFATLAAGCSGGGGPALTPRPTLSAPSTTAAKASVAFTMHWTSAAPTGLRHRNYVPATARSVTVSVNGAQTQYLNNPATTLTIAAPPGVDNFAFTTYDEQNGQGNALSAAVVTQTVLAGSGNFVSATLNGIVASLGVTLANAALPAGAAATTNVNVSALDADGNVIVGPGDYNTPIHLAVNDPSNSGTLSLSTNLVQTPGTPAAITLNYTGGTLASGLAGEPLATVVATAQGLNAASVAFTPTPTLYYVGSVIDTLTRQGGYVGGITAGPDGNMWITDYYNDAIDKVTPAGVFTSYPLGDTGGLEPYAIISASDGNLWFTEEQTQNTSLAGRIGFITPAGKFTQYNSVGPSPTALLDGQNGSIYYLDRFSGIGEQYIGSSSSTLDETADTNAGSDSASMTLGPDRSIYYAGSGQIGKLSLGNFGNPGSHLTVDDGAGGEVAGLVRGPDGNIWVSQLEASQIGVLSPTTFTITKNYPTLTQGEPETIVAAEDGALWFYNDGKLSRVTTGGVMTDFTASGGPLLAIAQDGSIWLSTEAGLEKFVY